MTKKNYGVQYGGKYLRHHLVEELKIHFKDSFETIGSEDELYPRGILYSLQYNFGGMKTEMFDFKAIVSSIDELIHVFKQQTEENASESEEQKQNYEEQSLHKFSSQYIAKMLNLKLEEREPLEGSLFFEFGLLQTMLPFDNTTVPNIYHSKFLL